MNNDNSISEEFKNGDIIYYFDCEKYKVVEGVFNEDEDYRATTRFTEIYKTPETATHFGSVKLQSKKYESENENKRVNKHS